MIAERSHWKNLPFGEVEPVPYRATFEAGQLPLLTQGFIPRQMEDKWFIFFEEPYLFLHRSWTGQAVYRVRIERHEEGFQVTDAVCARDAVQREPEDEAKLLEFLIANLLLGESRPFPLPAGLPNAKAGIYQHAVSGTGYPIQAASGKPWWAFWR